MEQQLCTYRDVTWNQNISKRKTKYMFPEFSPDTAKAFKAQTAKPDLTQPFRIQETRALVQIIYFCWLIDEK